MIERTVIFNLTAGTRTVFRRRTGDSVDEHRGLVGAEALSDGDHYVDFEICMGRGTMRTERERVRVDHGPDIYVDPPVWWEADDGFTSVSKTGGFAARHNARSRG